MDLQWYIRRFRVMDASEIVHRFGEQWSLKRLQVQYRRRPAAGHPDDDWKRFEFCKGSESRLPLSSEFSRPVGDDPQEAGDFLDGKVKASGFDWTWRPGADVWHEAPDTGRIWPQTFFGSIPYRSGNPYGDVRIAWEPSRLQHLIPLALLADRAEPEIGDRAARLLEEQFLSWVEANPFMKGIHYISSMECGLRILAACHALDIGRRKLSQPDRVWPALLDLVKGHAGLIFQRPSLYSSSGNHTIAESAALVYAGVLFPEFRGAQAWKKQGLSILEREADRQILPDGGGIEQAFGYQRFIVDLYGIVIGLLQHFKQAVPPAVRDAHRRGRSFLNAFAETSDPWPSIGDGDNGYALSPLLQPPCEERQRPPVLTTFEEAGYSVIRSGAEEQALLIFDHGPLGMPPSYGHGHADALSVLFRSGKQEILADSGTYTYTGDTRWRSYFRGTSAHNTVTVDGLDQAVQETPFMWSHPFQSRLIRREKAGDGEIRLLASHDGYHRLKWGVEHRRAVIHRPPGLWLIVDRLTGEGVHTLDLRWHCGILPVPYGDGFLLTARGRDFSLVVEGGEISLHSGEEDPVSGWKSDRYGSKEPITTLRARYQGGLPHGFMTQIRTGSEPSMPSKAERSLIEGWMDEAQTNRVARRAGGLR